MNRIILDAIRINPLVLIGRNLTNEEADEICQQFKDDKYAEVRQFVRAKVRPQPGTSERS